MAIQDLTASLDLKQNLNIYATCKQFDDLILELNIYDNSLQADLSNYDVRLKALKADKVPLIQQHIGITINSNVVNIEADEQLTTTSGKTLVELQFINKTTGKKKAAFNLVLIVVASVLDVNATISKSTYTLLEELENKLDQASDFFENIDDAINANNELKDTITDSEIAKTNLDGSITTADASKIALDTSNTNATNTKNDLDTLNTTANNTKNSLNTVNQTGQSLLNSLETFESQHADVSDISNKLANVNTQLSEMVNINVLDYGLKGDGNLEDLTQLKTLLQTKLINKTLLFPSNKIYRINSNLDVIAQNCNINILGTIVLEDCDGINLQDVNECNININVITYKNTYNVWYDYNNGKNIIDYSTFSKYGLRLNNARNNRININKIHGLKCGIYLAPSTYILNETETVSGSQYNEIHFGQIEACTYPIIFERLASSTWANSNFFYGGMLSGSIAVYMKTGSFAGDVYNQNVFYNIGCEYLKGGGFLLEEGKQNSFYEFRHDKVDNYYVKTYLGTYNNKFETQYSGFLEGYSIDGKNNVVKMPNYLYSDPNTLISDETIFTETGSKKINKANVLVNNANSLTESYYKSGDTPFTSYYKIIKDVNGKERVLNQFSSFTSISNGTLTITNKNMQNVFYLNTLNAGVTVKFDNTAQAIDYGHRYAFMTTGNFSNIPIFQDKDGNVISSLTGKINTADCLYYVIYLGGEYACFKIGTRQ